MGEAKRRGDYARRRAQAIASGRMKLPTPARMQRPHPLMKAAIAAALGPLARARKTEVPRET